MPAACVVVTCVQCGKRVTAYIPFRGNGMAWRSNAHYNDQGTRCRDYHVYGEGGKVGDQREGITGILDLSPAEQKCFRRQFARLQETRDRRVNQNR